ncbi:MAG: hypothetical protein RLY86_1860 [Pseudomonadota bacterium]|jgi:AcrR family transcriptional regulator
MAQGSGPVAGDTDRDGGEEGAAIGIRGRRARKPEAKDARRRHLLDSAERLFLAGDGSLPGSREIAEAAGLSKGTPYLYFRSVEDIFLSLLADHMDRWMEAMGAALDQAPRPLTAPALARAQSAYVVENTVLLRLGTLAHPQLERRGAEEAIRAFKLRSAGMVGAFGQRLEQALAPQLPDLSPGTGAKALVTSYAVVIGMWQLCEPTPVAKEVLASEPTLAGFRLDFADELLPALTAHWCRFVPDGAD